MTTTTDAVRRVLERDAARLAGTLLDRAQASADNGTAGSPDDALAAKNWAAAALSAGQLFQTLARLPR